MEGPTDDQTKVAVGVRPHPHASRHWCTDGADVNRALGPGGLGPTVSRAALARVTPGSNETWRALRPSRNRASATAVERDAIRRPQEGAGSAPLDDRILTGHIRTKRQRC